MTTGTAALKDSRLDLRMTRDQKSQIERAASISGVSVSQWSISRLLESARKDIDEDASLRLSTKAFDEFATLLEECDFETFEAFEQESTRWER